MADDAQPLFIPIKQDGRDTDAALLLAAKKEKKIRAARTSLLDFIEYCMADPEKNRPGHPDYDPLATRYEAQPHHLIMIHQFEETVVGRLLRSALSIPPQHGKSTIWAEYGLAWYAGKNPEKKILYGTYSEDRAARIGGSVRRIMELERFADVFPNFKIRPGEKSKRLIGFGEEGSIMFLGRNSGGSGEACDLFIIDDPFKNRAEARSKLVREEVWDWFCGVVEARCPALTPIGIIHTRWSEDDLIARVADSDHPNYDPDEHDQYDYLNIPAILYPEDSELAARLGMDPTQLPAALWPVYRGKPKFPLDLLLRRQKTNPVMFSAIYMGRPIPAEGDIYKKEAIKGYRQRDIQNKTLTPYGASDHAVSVTQRADHTCMGIGMVDSEGNVYIHRDLVWDKIQTPKQVSEMARLIDAHSPRKWWSEGDHIKKSIGPFLKMYLKKHRIFKTIFVELSKASDKVQKSQPIAAIASLGMLYLPVDAPWYARAVAQMLRFDGTEGRADDFCDFLSNLGRGLGDMKMVKAPKPDAAINAETGTAAWVKMAWKEQQRDAKRIKHLEGF